MKIGDHPRVCGEQSPYMRGDAVKAGSPPRVRGTVAFIYLLWHNFRITPACAGNRLQFVKNRALASDHPRVCGEQMSLSSAHIQHRGSPPRVRGTGLAFRALWPHDGITPACAGNSTSTLNKAGDVGDHPRVCGEQPDDWA